MEWPVVCSLPGLPVITDLSVLHSPCSIDDLVWLHCIQIEAPPLYDRAVSQLLAPARAAAGGGGISMLPGGSEATKRRARAEACYMFDSKDSSVPAQIAVKRKKLSDNRCFNCGSYAHGLADCTKPMDQVGRYIVPWRPHPAVSLACSACPITFLTRYLHQVVMQEVPSCFDMLLFKRSVLKHAVLFKQDSYNSDWVGLALHPH